MASSSYPKQQSRAVPPTLYSLAPNAKSRTSGEPSVSALSAPTAYCLLKSRPTAHFTYEEMLNAYTNDQALDFGDPSTIVVLPQRIPPLQSPESNEAPAIAMAKLRLILKDEAIPIDKRISVSESEAEELPAESFIWVLPFDPLSVLTSLARLGFVASECTVKADGEHTWTLRCCDKNDSNGNACEEVGHVMQQQRSGVAGRIPAYAANKYTVSNSKRSGFTSNRTNSNQKRRAYVNGDDYSDHDDDYRPFKRRTGAQAVARAIAYRTQARERSQVPRAVVQQTDEDYIANFDDAAYSIQLRDPTTADRPRECMFCPKSFKTVYETMRHIRSHTGEKPYACYVCGKALSQKSEVVKHLKSHRLYRDPEWNADKTAIVREATSFFVCPHCQKSTEPEEKPVEFADAKSFLHHIRNDHDQNTMQYKCFNCRLMFSNIADIGMHYNLEHTNVRDMLLETAAVLPAGHGDREENSTTNFDQPDESESGQYYEQNSAASFPNDHPMMKAFGLSNTTPKAEPHRDDDDDDDVILIDADAGNNDGSNHYNGEEDGGAKISSDGGDAAEASPEDAPTQSNGVTVEEAIVL